VDVPVLDVDSLEEDMFGPDSPDSPRESSFGGDSAEMASDAEAGFARTRTSFLCLDILQCEGRLLASIGQ
jgi:hypothetical protein